MVHSRGFFLDFLQKIREAGVKIPVDTAIIKFTFTFSPAVPPSISNSIKIRNIEVIMRTEKIAKRLSFAFIVLAEVWCHGLICLSCRMKVSPVSNAVMPVMIIAVLPGEPDLSCVKRM